MTSALQKRITGAQPGEWVGLSVDEVGGVDSLQPGDLVCNARTGGTHCDMYIGNGKVAGGNIEGRGIGDRTVIAKAATLDGADNIVLRKSVQGQKPKERLELPQSIADQLAYRRNYITGWGVAGIDRDQLNNITGEAAQQYGINKRAQDAAKRIAKAKAEAKAKAAEKLAKAEANKAAGLGNAIQEALKRKLLKEQGIPSYLLANTDEPEPEESTPDIDLITPNVGQKLYSDLAAIEQRRTDREEAQADQDATEMAQAIGMPPQTVADSPTGWLPPGAEYTHAGTYNISFPEVEPRQTHTNGKAIGHIAQSSESGKDGKTSNSSQTGLGGHDSISKATGFANYGSDEFGNKGEDPGGFSFGRFQFMTRMIVRDGELTPTLDSNGKPNDPAKSTMAELLRSDELADPIKNALNATMMGENGEINYNLLASPEFIKVWTSITTHPETRQKFGTMQKNFLIKNNYEPVIRDAQSFAKGIRTEANSKQIDGLFKNEFVIEAVYAAGVQNPSKAMVTLRNTLAAANEAGTLGDIEEFINTFYVERGKAYGTKTNKAPRMIETEEYVLKDPTIKDEKLRNSLDNRATDENGLFKMKMKQEVDADGNKLFDITKTPKHPRTAERKKIVRAIQRKKSSGPKSSTAAPPINEGRLRNAIQEALKRKLSPLKEVEEMSSAKLYQVVLVLSVTRPIRDIAGKLNRIRAIEGVTIVSHEREEETIYRGDVVAKVKFHPTNDMMTPATFINQYLVPQINSSKIVPEVKVLQAVRGTIKEIT
jgi:hypothetical protein